MIVIGTFGLLSSQVSLKLSCILSFLLGRKGGGLFETVKNLCNFIVWSVLTSPLPQSCLIAREKEFKTQGVKIPN